MSENKWRRSSFSGSDSDIHHSAVSKRGPESFLGTEYNVRPVLESSICSTVRSSKRSRYSGHPAKQLSDTTIRQSPGLLENQRFGVSSAHRAPLARKSGPCRKCRHGKDRTETASAALRRNLRNRSSDDITTILRTTQIIAAARRPMTVNEIDFAINTRLPSPYYLRDSSKSEDKVQKDCADDENKSLALCQDLLKFDNNGVVANGVVEFCNQDMRNLISSAEFRQNFGLPHEDEILAAICIQHLGCHRESNNETESTGAVWCPVAEEEACALRDYALSFWKEHYLRMRGGSQVVHSLLHETMVSALSRAAPWERRCQRGCNDILATGLEMAATHNLPVIGKAYFEMGAEFRKCNHSTHTPLHTAAANSSTEMISLLLDCGADPNAFANDSLEPRTCSCSTADADASTALALLNTGHTQCHCWRCCTCFSGRTPLHLAAAIGQETSTRSLVAGGADINLSTKRYGETALHLATRAGRFGIVQFLVASGAEIGRQNSVGATALQFAKTGHKYLIAKLLLAAAPPVVIEPAIDDTYVEARYDRDRSTSPTWRMHALSLDDSSLKLSGVSSKTARDTTCHTTFDLTNTQTPANDKEPPLLEENWILVESPEVLRESQ